MKNTNFPRPKNFPYDEVFYYDHEIAIMCGHYKDQQTWSLGLRWEIAESDLGYPSIRGHKVWVVIPDIIAVYILEGLIRDYSNEDIETLNNELAKKYLEILKNQISFISLT